MDKIPNLYIERLKTIRNYLCLILELLQKRTPNGIVALFERASALLPYNADRSLKKFPLEITQAEKKRTRFEEGFKILVALILENLAQMLKEANEASEIEVELSMSLASDDPAAKENDDNLLFNVYLPWSDLWPFILNGEKAPNAGAAAILYQYLLDATLPVVEPAGFLRVKRMDVDITRRETRAYRLENGAQKAVLMDYAETAALLSPALKNNCGKKIPEIPAFSKKIQKFFLRLLNKINKLLVKYDKRSAGAEKLAIEIDSLLHGYDKISMLKDIGDCLLSYKKFPKWNKFNDVHHAIMQCLDGVMRELEELAIRRIGPDEGEIAEKNYSINNFSVTEMDYAEDSVLSFWTKKEGLPFATPFWSQECGTGLFMDGEDWHEFHPYKPMCYLSHIAFVDGDLPFTELEHIDYISWEMSFTHDISLELT